MSKQYTFYCTICGDQFTAQKKHARCCSSECRVVLSNVMRYEVTDGEMVREAVDKDEVAEKYTKTTGKELNPKVLKSHPEKEKSEDDAPTATSKLLGKKKDRKKVVLDQKVVEKPEEE